MTRPNPHYIDRNHPVRAILEAASFGRLPTSGQLDRELNRTDLPDGHDLARFRAAVTKAAAEIAKVAQPEPGVNNHGEAKRMADNHAAELAAQMTDEEAQVPPFDAATTEDLSDLGRRIFESH